MEFNPQPNLENELITLRPLKENDFEALFAIASDPLIWEQHPSNDRYKREVFQQFFNTGIAGHNSLTIIENTTGRIIGTSRYYDIYKSPKTIAIGYTFIGRDFWAKGYNASLKTLMLNYAFFSAEQVIFHIGHTNYRSQKAVEKLGGHKIGEEEVINDGIPSGLNFVYGITKSNWEKRHT